jgi:hypothetical protein
MMRGKTPIYIFQIPVVFILALLVGCDGESPTFEDLSCDLSELSDASVDESGIVPEQVNGIWIFSYTPDGWNDARNEGIARIVGDCLVVRDMAVIWHSNQLPKVRNLVSKVLAGESPRVELGGSEMSLDDTEGEGDVYLPAEILERCPTIRSVWYSGCN